MRTSDEIRALINTLNWGNGMTNPPYIITADPVYSVPTEDFLLGEALSAFKANLEITGIGAAIKDLNDCDKFVFRFINFIHDDHYLTMRPKVVADPSIIPTGVGVGLFAYINLHIFPSEAHLAAFSLKETPQGLAVDYIECVPENGIGRLDISEMEIASISFAWI